MLKTNLLNARIRLQSLIDKTIATNQPIGITTKNGNAVILSEQDYRNMLETIYIEEHPKYKAELLKAMEEFESAGWGFEFLMAHQFIGPKKLEK